MRKIGIFLALLAFILFLFLGFQVAKLFAAPGEIQSGDLPSQDEVAQSNILLVHVDQLDRENPALVSLWVIFSYRADPVSLTFLPIYPTGKEGETDQAALFSLSSDKKISPDFLERLQNQYNLQWSRLILIDDAGASYWSQFMTGTPFSQTISSDPRTLIQPETDLISAFCDSVRERGSGLLTSFEWNQIIPDHMRTDLPFDSVVSELDRIQKSGLCDVFGQ